MGITCVYIKIRTTLCILFCNLFFHLVHICRTFHFVCPYLPKKLLYNIPLYWSLFNCSFLYEHLYGFEFFININDTVKNSFHFEHFGKHFSSLDEELLDILNIWRFFTNLMGKKYPCFTNTISLSSSEIEQFFTYLLVIYSFCIL